MLKILQKYRILGGYINYFKYAIVQKPLTLQKTDTTVAKGVSSQPYFQAMASTCDLGQVPQFLFSHL